MTVYQVYILGDGDIFKGYNNRFIGTFKDESIADDCASFHGGYVEEDYGNYHPEFNFMDDEWTSNASALRQERTRIICAAREMLANGG